MKADCGFAAEIDISLVPVYYTVAKPTRVRQRLMNISKVLFAALLADLSKHLIGSLINANIVTK